MSRYPLYLLLYDKLELSHRWRIVRLILRIRKVACPFYISRQGLWIKPLHWQTWAIATCFHFIPHPLIKDQRIRSPRMIRLQNRQFTSFTWIKICMPNMAPGQCTPNSSILKDLCSTICTWILNLQHVWVNLGNRKLTTFRNS